MTNKADSPLGEAVVSGVNKLLGEMVQAAIISSAAGSPWQGLPNDSLELAPMRESKPVIKGMVIPSGGPALACRETLRWGLSQSLSGHWGHSHTHSRTQHTHTHTYARTHDVTQTHKHTQTLSCSQHPFFQVFSASCNISQSSLLGLCQSRREGPVLPLLWLRL